MSFAGAYGVPLDVAIPFFFYEIRYVLFAFFPIVAAEAVVILVWMRRDRPASFLSALGCTALANLLTTLVGYGLQAVIRFLVFKDFHTRQTTVWEGLMGITTAPKIGNLLLPNVIQLFTSLGIGFVLSYFLEFWIVARLFRRKGDSQLRKAVMIANLVSYVGLGLWAVYAFHKRV